MQPDPSEPSAPSDAGGVVGAEGTSGLRPPWQRQLWKVGGLLSLLAGFVGVFLPVLPTAPFILLAAHCFAQGSPRLERWLLQHPTFGPITRDWRTHRAVPLRAKQLATVMMTISSVGTWLVIPSIWRWAPGICCLLAAIWLWSLPTRKPH